MSSARFRQPLERVDAREPCDRPWALGVVAVKVVREQLGAARHKRLGPEDATVGEVTAAIQQAIYGGEDKLFLYFPVHKLRVNGCSLH